MDFYKEVALRREPCGVGGQSSLIEVVVYPFPVSYVVPFSSLLWEVVATCWRYRRLWGVSHDHRSSGAAVAIASCSVCFPPALGWVGGEGYTFPNSHFRVSISGLECPESNSRVEFLKSISRTRSSAVLPRASYF